MAKVHLRSCPGQHLLLQQPEISNHCHYHQKDKIPSENSGSEKDDFKTKKVISKILQSFSKATPRKITKIGNNIPDHYLMKSLLSDFYQDHQNFTESEELLIKNKKDKVTSTTGLDKLVQKSQNVPCKCHRICNRHFYDPKICNPNSYLREMPSDLNLPVPDVPKYRKHNLCPKHHCFYHRNDHIFRIETKLYDEVPTKESNIQVVFENNHFDPKRKLISNVNDEKSTDKFSNKGFVKDQIEKYNTMLRNGAQYNKMIECVKQRIPNYILVPQEENKSVITNENDWNGSIDSSFSVRGVHFPKETKQAMSTLIEERIKSPEKSRASISSARICSKNLLCLRGDHEGPCHKIS